MISLYIKIHNITGLKYFGKTSRDPVKYNGSGKYWKRHLETHGKDLTTIIVGQFTDMEECKAVALAFSKEHDIVNSPEWANLIEENGLDGASIGHPGHVFTDEQLHKISKSSKKNWGNTEFRTKTLTAQKQAWTEDRRNEYSERSLRFWTESQRFVHSEKMKALAAKRPDFIIKFEEYVKRPRSQVHKDGISAALKDKPKSLEHRANLAFIKIKQANPGFPFESYRDFAIKCKELFDQGQIRYHIAEALGVTHNTVTKALNYLKQRG